MEKLLVLMTVLSKTSLLSTNKHNYNFFDVLKRQYSYENIKLDLISKTSMKVSELCKMIEDSIHRGKYPLDDQQQRFANLVQVINRSDSDNLKGNDIKIEVRIQDLYTINNYIS